MTLHNPISKGRWMIAQKAEADYWHGKNVLIRGYNRIKQKYASIMQCYAAALPNDIDILDLGCGPTCPAQFIGKGRKTFVDPLLDQFRRAFPGTLPQGKFIASMAEDMDSPDASFDFILCINALNHMQNPELVLNEVDRLLKPHGVFIISVITYPQLIARLRYIRECHFSTFRDDQRPYAYTFSGMRKTLLRHFDIIEQINANNHGLFPSLTSNWIFVCRHKKYFHG